ncbi:MAG: CPA2 family monovalent cation:H+ antiporter-2 [Phycisphaerales bacterium]|jgi:CPA2 family monovalent cation:H+ antiporter-2
MMLPNPELVLLAAGTPPAAVVIDLLKILACAGLVAAALGRLHIAVIPGFLIAGAIIGPGALGLIDDAASIQEITSVAIVLLMFGIGLHLDASVLRRGAATIIAAGILTTVGTVLVATPVAMLFGLAWPSAVAVAMAVSLSSTAVVMRLLQQKREVYSSHGRLTFGVLLMQDLLVVIMLAVLPVLAAVVAKGESVSHDASQALPASGGAASLGHTTPPIWVALITVGLMIVLGKVLLPRFMTLIAKGRSEEILLVIAAAVALGASVLTGYVGLSPELGAFLAGFLLSATPFRYQLSGQISPLRDLFMAVFFTAVGLELNLTTIWPDLHWVLLGTLLVLSIKATIISTVSWAVGASAPIAARAGITLAQAGEFSLLIAASAIGMGVITDQTGSVLIAVVVLSLIVTPWLETLGGYTSRRIMHVPPAPWFKLPAIGEAVVRPSPEQVAGQTPEDGADCPVEVARASEVIVAGFGPVGRACVERFDKAGVRSTIVELNALTVRTQAALGRSVVFGDITNPEVLQNAGLDEAQAVLITMPDHEVMLRAVSVIRSLRPDIYIAVRASLVSWAHRAKELGANDVAVSELTVAEALAKHAMKVAEAGELRKNGPSRPAEPE